MPKVGYVWMKEIQEFVIRAAVVIKNDSMR